MSKKARKYYVRFNKQSKEERTIIASGIKDAVSQLRTSLGVSRLPNGTRLLVRPLEYFKQADSVEPPEHGWHPQLLEDTKER